MGGPPVNSQAVPLPSSLPFRIVSKTIGCGAYASIRKAIPLTASSPVIAVKFINKDHAFRSGRLRPKQLHIELSLHAHVSPHQNIIKYIRHGEDDKWVWLALELAEGGDLFDKIEADEGVSEDVAHLYFVQLVSAMGWCHGKGVAHRDIKPENMLLSGEGDLKLADFGLATQFMEPRSGKRKTCGMVCGSPPYIAPEIIKVGNANSKRKNEEGKQGYDPQGADVWSCAIVLFVLLVGNTPWDTPIMEESFEYHDYVTSNHRPSDELWQGIPSDTLSLIRGMLNPEPVERLTLENVKKHPWFTRKNAFLNAEKGKAANPISLATQMMESLHIDVSASVQSSQRRRQPHSQGDAMDMDIPQVQPTYFASTQPETPIADIVLDWEAPPRLGGGISASQPQSNNDRASIGASATGARDINSLRMASLQDLFSEDPSMSQFSTTPSVPLTLTQAARKFKDIVPSHSLARFISILTFNQLLPMLLSALHHLSIPIAEPSTATFERDGIVSLRIKTLDAQQQVLQGNVLVEKITVQGFAGGMDVLEVRFMKAKGDPLGWRRLFKQIAVLCKDAVVIPGGQGQSTQSQMQI